LSERSRRSPLPQRQVLGHQRVRQLVAFTEHQNASVPKIFADDASSSNHEADEGTGTTLPPSSANELHPPAPPFFSPPMTTSTSSTSLSSSYDRSSPPSDGTRPGTANSLSKSPTLSVKRSDDRPELRPRPHSMASIGTSQTTTRSRLSIRGAPHAPHNNIQIVLPAPLAPSLHRRPASAEPRLRRPFGVESMYTESWRSSMVDTWISVGQHGTPELEPIERQRSRDSMEQRSRLTRRGPSPVDMRRRSRSNPSPLSRTSGPSLDRSSQDTHPPVPRVPSKYGTLSGQHDSVRSNTREHRASWNSPSSFIGTPKV